MLKKILAIIGTVSVFLFVALMLVLSLRGIEGNPSPQTMNEVYWTDNGPFELSPERGRFALTYSIVEDNSFHFSLPVARFATPDLGYKDGNYVSLFAPGISYLIIPGYILGKSFLLGQVGSYAAIALFAFLNVVLIRQIVMRLGGSSLVGIIAGFTFLFATPAFAYSVSLFQHHVSTFLILLSLYLVFRYNNFFSLFVIWLLCAASIPIDYPNLILMFPIGIYALTQVVYGKLKGNKFELNIQYVRILSFLAVVFPLWFFLWFNQNSYGNPLQFSGTVPAIKAIDEDGKPALPESENPEREETFVNPASQDKSAARFFQTRNTLNGLATHFVNRDRGMLWFSPVMFLSVIGMYVFAKKNKPVFAVLISVVGANFLLYSMWGDPYGGWAFGSRYLVPAYAILSIFIAFALQRFRRNIIFMIVFLILATYSIGISTIGALTSNRIPPKVEVLGLEQITGREEKYSFDRDYDLLKGNVSKSFVYQEYLRSYMSAMHYYYAIFGVIAIVYILSITALILKKEQT